MGATIAGTQYSIKSFTHGNWVCYLHPLLEDYCLRYESNSVLAIFLPTTFFAALDRGAQSVTPAGVLQPSGSIITAHTPAGILAMSERFN